MGTHSCSPPRKGGDPIKTLLGPKLPRELFAHVLSFWRSVRASAEDRAGDQLRGRFLPTPYSWWNGYGYRREVTWDGWVPSRVGDYSDSEYYGN